MTQESIFTTIRVFYEIFRRDSYVYFKRLKTYGINYTLINPINTVIAIGYLQVKFYFGADNYFSATELLAGNILLVLNALTFDFAFALLHDLEGDNHTSYQLLLLSPKLLLFEKIIFGSIFSFGLLFPFFPLCKLFLGASFYTTHTSWTYLFIMLFISLLCSTAYHLFAACTMKSSRSITNFWVRINFPLEFLGGFWTPLYIISSFSSIMGILSYCNPFIYISEGFRQAILGGKQYLSLFTCISSLAFFTTFFICSTFYVFKKKTDCV